MRFALDASIEAYCFLSLSYFALSCYSIYRVIKLHRACKTLSLSKLFATCCLVTTLLRWMVIACILILEYIDAPTASNAMAVVDLSNASLHDPPNASRASPAESNITSLYVHAGGASGVFIGDEAYLETPDFFSKALIVLFDFPDFSILSAYALLTIMWCEALTQTKYHWLNTRDLKRSWLKGYFVFQVLLYGTQCGLYSLLFVPSINQRFLSHLIYSALAFVNFGVPALWLAIAVNITCQLSGFPRGTKAAMERWRAVSRLGLVWTLARLFWGILSLNPFLDSWAMNWRPGNSLYSIELVAVFYLTEVIPIALALSSRSMRFLVGSGVGSGTSLGREEGGSHGLKDSEEEVSRPGTSESSGMDGYIGIGRGNKNVSMAPKARASGRIADSVSDHPSTLNSIFLSATWTGEDRSTVAAQQP